MNEQRYNATRPNGTGVSFESVSGALQWVEDESGEDISMAERLVAVQEVKHESGEFFWMGMKIERMPNHTT